LFYYRAVVLISPCRTCELSRKRKLREVYAYTALLNAAHQPKLHDLLFDAEPDENELRFLDENDIAK
jgi:chromatin modification-related protein VID21